MILRIHANVSIFICNRSMKKSIYGIYDRNRNLSKTLNYFGFASLINYRNTMAIKSVLLNIKLISHFFFLNPTFSKITVLSSTEKSNKPRIRSTDNENQKNFTTQLPKNQIKLGSLVFAKLSH